ncbi:KIF1-binding protein homolog [Acanthaster planci]|uniref:KIF-binding protein n=1 Tax=Acanthaster planci TaxID=133434 RepID=A0A8B7XP85_ACAPL|nr:KIF1-binding protein homolog [Acanthaster planci]
MAAYSGFLGSEGFSKFEEARKLSEEDSKNDPETNPFKSKYEARKILQDLRAKLEKYHGVHIGQQAPEDTDLHLLLACLRYHLGVNFVDTEETSSGEDYLTACRKMLEEYSLDTRAVGLVVATLNQLGILWSGRRELRRALEILLEAENVYKKYKHEIGVAPHGINELFVAEENTLTDHQRQQKFEKAYTHTLYYLAQVYGNLGDSKKSASHCHETLKRQLETNQYEAMDWALNCATLSQYYITQDDYTQARHCLASATRIYAETLEKLPAVETEADQYDDDIDKIKRHKADIARCWLKYCLALLNLSKDKLAEEVSRLSNDRDASLGVAETENQLDNRDATADEMQSAARESSEQENTESDDEKMKKLTLQFEGLELTSLESRVTDKCVVTFDEARELFLAGQKWITEAKEYYVLDGHVSDYIEIIRDHSALFKVLASFEVDLERRCRMHKRRVDMLQDILKELNPQHFLMVCRQLMFELAETTSEMMDLKIAIAESSEVAPTAHACGKVNMLIQQSLGYFQQFLDSLRDAEKKMPSTLEDDVMRPALVAYFCKARLYSKIVTPNPEQRIENLTTSLQNYKFVVDYCKCHPEAMEKMKAEYELCEEMVALLPARIAQVSRE